MLFSAHARWPDEAAGKKDKEGEMASPANTAPDRFLDVKNERLAYRRLGPDKGTPLVFLQRFGGPWMTGTRR
jgi:hypothetical protein